MFYSLLNNRYVIKNRQSLCVKVHECPLDSVVREKSGSKYDVVEMISRAICMVKCMFMVEYMLNLENKVTTAVMYRWLY